MVERGNIDARAVGRINRRRYEKTPSIELGAFHDWADYLASIF
jgi:hypothetical protein